MDSTTISGSGTGGRAWDGWPRDMEGAVSPCLPRSWHILIHTGGGMALFFWSPQCWWRAPWGTALPEEMADAGWLHMRFFRFAEEGEHGP